MALDEVYAPIWSTLDNFESYLDPWLTPDDFLTWLAGWVVIALDESWDEERRRAIVARAVELYRMRGFIDRGVYNVGEALVTGAVLVLVILFLFLLNFRTTLISLTAIPLSLADLSR